MTRHLKGESDNAEHEGDCEEKSAKEECKHQDHE